MMPTLLALISQAALIRHILLFPAVWTPQWGCPSRWKRSSPFSTHRRVLLPYPFWLCKESAQMMMEVLQAAIFTQPRVVMGLQCTICSSAPSSLHQPLSSFLLKVGILIVLPAEIQFWLWRCYFFFPQRNKVLTLKIPLLWLYLFIYRPRMDWSLKKCLRHFRFKNFKSVLSSIANKLVRNSMFSW